MISIRKNIPAGKTRVVYFDPFDHEDGVVKDCDTPEEAFQLADQRNEKRKSELDLVFYVYDDQGKYLRGEEAVTGPPVSP